jgi:mono/diheme cytochrome c family protein
MRHIQIMSIALAACLSLATLTARSQDEIALGKTLTTNNCAVCHTFGSPWPNVWPGRAERSGTQPVRNHRQAPRRGARVQVFGWDESGRGGQSVGRQAAGPVAYGHASGRAGQRDDLF